MDPDVETGASTFGLQASTIKIDDDVGSMSISPASRDIALGSRRGIIIVDLDNPYNQPRFLPHLSSWEIADVQWNVHASKAHWLVSTSNQKALIWNLDLPSHSAIEHVLNGHSRAITDINWSAFQPNVLATCAVDSWVHCWDLRAPRYPSMSFCEWQAGATQVKWNRQNEHILASTHGQNLKIWDHRYGAQPLLSICAHNTNVRGLDWNRIEASKLVTCGLDRTIKFWDYKKGSEQAEGVISTSFPVWRARHTPFGFGIMAMPQRGDFSLYLWDRRFEKKIVVQPPPVCKFTGHTDQIKEFLWRFRGGNNPDKDDREFQLITYSADHTLRIWPVTPEKLKEVGHNPDERTPFPQSRKGALNKTYQEEPSSSTKRDRLLFYSVPQRPRGLRSDSSTRLKNLEHMTKASAKASEGFPLTWMQGVHIGRPLNEADSTVGWDGPETIGEEIALLGQKFPRVDFERINVSKRNCVFSLSGPWGEGGTFVFLRAEVNFPANYPESGCPKFAIEMTSDISSLQMDEINDSLRNISRLHAERNRPSLEACIRFLLGEKAANSKWTLESETSSSSSDEEDGVDNLDNEVRITTAPNFPLPKKCAAVFAPNGMLHL